MWYSVGLVHRCIEEMKNESKEMKNEIQRRWQDEMNCHNLSRKGLRNGLRIMRG